MVLAHQQYAFLFQKQVLRCLAAWMDWAVFTPDFLIELENVFLGHIEKPGQTEVRDKGGFRT